MYGGLEVADLLRLGRPIEDQERAPFVKKRGIKFNIPLDARTPSYDDTGDSAQNNIETVWDFEFWKAYLDDLARYRYNVLSLWSTHPFPSIIKIEDYPEVALDDVYRIGVDIYPHYKNKWQDVDFDKPSSVFTGNVINYDFLPTFVDWAGGDSEKLQNIDGVSLADYMAGKEPRQGFSESLSLFSLSSLSEICAAFGHYFWFVQGDPFLRTTGYSDVVRPFWRHWRGYQYCKAESRKHTRNSTMG